MEATVNLVLGLIGLGGFFLLINKIRDMFFSQKIQQEDAKVIDLTKKISEQKILIGGQQKTAQEVLDEYRKQAEAFNKFDGDDEPPRSAS